MKKEVMVSVLFLGIILLGCTTEEPAIAKVHDTISAGESSSPEQKIMEEAKIDITANYTTEQSPSPIVEELSFEEQVWKKRIDAAMDPSPCPDIPKPEYL